MLIISSLRSTRKAGRERCKHSHLYNNHNSPVLEFSY